MRERTEKEENDPWVKEQELIDPWAEFRPPNWYYEMRKKRKKLFIEEVCMVCIVVGVVLFLFYAK